MGFDSGRFTFWELYGSALVGLAVTFLLVAITEYYTGTRWNPVKAIAKASQTGHATNIIEGLAMGMQATALPVIVIVAGILVSHHLAGLYGIGVAVMAQLSMTGLIVALDAYGPVTDNAGGIAEMAHLPDEVRAVTDPLDAVGNTTKAVTKGYAIGSAALAALILFDSYTTGLSDHRPHHVLLALGPVGDRRPVHRRADAVPVRVARDAGGRSRRRPGGRGGAPPVPRAPRDHGRHREAADYSRRSASYLSAIKSMLAPALIPIGFPIIVGIISVKMLGGLLIGTIVTGSSSRSR
jgi:Inorganic pyrophosphatase